MKPSSAIFLTAEGCGVGGTECDADGVGEVELFGEGEVGDVGVTEAVEEEEDVGWYGGWG